MQQQDLKLDIASRLLSGIVSQDRNRKLLDRLDDIDHSLEVADELIRRSKGDAPPTRDHTLQPRPITRTREKVIQREQLPLQQILEARRAGSQSKPSRGPTLH
ncbi:hypothetical protein QFW77_14675 [Luteimonas sp. RD2P54]|uniref:Uncharacterized protein n=1 Tax=Luteimonas endophytica TaxID=3042023 RepID=A0ABT6JBM3_9GAMM|nr:hypothetical protein [Luteimonas endophytica]MDH5824223.1 hypothetical protein [Luteimonas endophytica]